MGTPQDTPAPFVPARRNVRYLTVSAVGTLWPSLCRYQGGRSREEGQNPLTCLTAATGGPPGWVDMVGMVGFFGGISYVGIRPG